MLKTVTTAAAILLLTSVTPFIGGCGCGFDCNNGNNSDNVGPTRLSLGLSDSVPEELKQVVIEVDSITFRRSGADNVVVDTFTIDELDLVEADSFQIDLLQYRGQTQLLVIENLELDSASYSEVLVNVLDGDINRSYTQEADDSLKEINAPQAGLSLPGITLSGGEQVFTIEFGLAQSLQYQTGSDNYLLTNDGVRVEDNATAAGLSGRVDSALFDTVSPCDEKTEPELGNRIYLYEGVGLSDGQLADVFTQNSSTAVPADVLAPYAVATLVKNPLAGGWEYAFGFIPPGDYTVAFSCDTAEDDPVDYDELTVPLPEDQTYEITLSDSEQAVCDLADGGSC
jgi:hypothetical protein